MRRIFVFALVVVVLGTLTAAAPVAGQDVGEAAGNATANATDGTDPGQVMSDDVNEPVDEYLTLVSWEYEDGDFRLTFDAERGTRMTITEAIQFSEGTGQMTIHQQSITSGRSTVSIPVERRGGEAAVTIVTSRSLRNSRGIYVSTGTADDPRPPIGWSAAQGLILLTGVGSAFVTQRWVRRKYENEDKEVERIA